MDFDTLDGGVIIIGHRKRKLCKLLDEMEIEADEEDSGGFDGVVIPFNESVVSNVLNGYYNTGRATAETLKFFECSDFLNFAPGMRLYAHYILHTLMNPLSDEDMLNVDACYFRKLLDHVALPPCRLFLMRKRNEFAHDHFFPETHLLDEFFQLYPN